ncbi:MAG: aa3-type cytochrome c oxidase subunit IV [Alphaproteobacteria bacterium]|nr:MAG: aa3-type cytochrome c oxidase subunit IV [Alphaproteobacteria bacterium]
MSTDIEAKEKAYHGFTAFAKWGTLAVAVIVAIVVFGFVA